MLPQPLMLRSSAVLLGAAALVGGAGCNVFDPALYMAVEAKDAAPGPADGEPPVDAASEAAPPVPTLVARCEVAPPTVASSATPFAVDTNALGNDYSEFTACVMHDLPGNDGFVTVMMNAGEKWHVHINPMTPEFDPGIYILGSCDTRAC